MENGQKNFTKQSEVSPENTISIKKVDPFFNEVFFKLHIDGKVTLTEDRREIKSIEDEGLKEFAEKYGPRWPFLFLVVSHPEVQKDWRPDNYNSVDNTYPRIFVHRQFSEETPELFKYQEQHAGIAIDDLSVKSLPDTLDENMFIRNRLTEGNIKHEFVLKDIPKHKVLDLRSFGLSIENVGSALGGKLDKSFLEKLKKSQFDMEKIEEMKKLIQEDKTLRDQVALFIINDNSAIVLDPDYLINIDLLKDKLKLIDVGTTPIPEVVLSANEAFKQGGSPEDVDGYIASLAKLSGEIKNIVLTTLQEEKLDKELVNFIGLGFVYDDMFDVLYKKLSLLKNLPKEKLQNNHIDFLNKVEELYQKGLQNFEKNKEIYLSHYGKGGPREKSEEIIKENLSYIHMDSFQEPLKLLIAEMAKFDSNKS